MRKLRYKLEQEPLPSISRKDWEAYFKIKHQIRQLKRLYKENNISNIENSIEPLNIFLKNIRKINQDMFIKGPRGERTFNAYPAVYRLSIDNKKYTSTKKKQFISKFILGGVASLTNVGGLRIAKAEILAQLRQARQQQRTMNFITKNYQDSRNGTRHSYTMIKSEKYGSVHLTPESIYNIFIAKTEMNIFEYKSPKLDAPHLGIEIEMFCKWDKTKLAAEFVKAKLGQYVTIKTDSSIRPDRDYIAHELCLLVPETDHQIIVKKVCGVLAQAEAKVNKSCGLHVHLDMRKRDKDLVFNNLVAAQPILYAMNPKSRKEGTYCKTTTTTKFNEAGDDRYRGINPQAYSRHKTLEVRIHSGTVSEDKILNWIQLLLLIVNEKEMKRTTRYFRIFVKQYNINADLAGYIAQRIEKFNTEVEPLEEAA